MRCGAVQHSLKKEATSFVEASVYQATQHHIPEDSVLQTPSSSSALPLSFCYYSHAFPSFSSSSSPIYFPFTRHCFPLDNFPSCS